MATAHRAYPHVDAITDWRAQQSIRLLWDQVAALGTRLTAVEGTLGDLVKQVDGQKDRLDTLQHLVGEALAGVAADATKAAGGDGSGGVDTMPDYSSIVSDTLAGFNPIVAAADEDAGKAQLTRAAAWAIYAVDPNIRLFFKDYGTQVNNRSVDVLVLATDGSFADCASSHDNGDGTVTILATWGTHAADSNTSDESRYIVPTAAIAAESGPMAILP